VIRPAEVRPSARPWPEEVGGRTAVVILLSQGFSEKLELVPLRLNSSKKSPHDPPWFLKAVLWTYRPIRICFWNRRKLSAAKENCGKKSAMNKKFFFFNLIFPLKKKIVWNIFFLFLIANCAKFRMKQKKGAKKIFYLGKKTAKRSLVILSALVKYTAPTVGYTSKMFRICRSIARWTNGYLMYLFLLCAGAETSCFGSSFDSEFQRNVWFLIPDPEPASAD
jgi:hypothetical protein